MASATTRTNGCGPRPANADPNLIPEFWVWQAGGWHGDHMGSGRHIDGDSLTNLELSAIVVRVVWSAQIGGWA